MWFKNLQLFRLTGDFKLNPEQLHEQLLPAQFRRCGSLEPASIGWVPPLGRDAELLTHASGDAIMICARREERVLPAAVIRDEVEERVREIEEEQMRPVRRKEKQQIKEDVTLELLPKAFTRSALTYAWIDPKQGWLVIDSASAKRAEDLIALLRKSLERFPVMPPVTTQAPATVMTQWLTGEQASGDFLPEDQCELRDADDGGGVVRCRGQDLEAEEVRKHIEAGKLVVRLAVTWQERISAVISDDLIVRRLRFEDLVQEQLDDLGDVDRAALFDAEFTLMVLELNRFLPALLTAFGGEQVNA